MYIKCEKGPDGIVIRTGFDKFDPENESLRQVVIDSIEKMVKTQLIKINDELYKAKRQEEKLKKEIDKRKNELIEKEKENKTQ